LPCGNDFCVFTIDLFYQCELGHPIHYRNQSALMVLTYHGVNLPVANAGFFGNDGGAFVNTDTISDLAAFILGSMVLFTLLVAFPSMRIQAAAMTLVCPDRLADAFMADQDTQLIIPLS
jgi:hypothetical protein